MVRVIYVIFADSIRFVITPADIAFAIIADVIF
jgi:hypothetical protein